MKTEINISLHPRCVSFDINEHELLLSLMVRQSTDSIADKTIKAFVAMCKEVKLSTNNNLDIAAELEYFKGAISRAIENRNHI